MSAEPLEPEGRDLIEDGAFFRDGIGQDHIKGRNPIRDDEKKGIAQIKNFPNLAAAQFFYSREIHCGLRSDLHKKV